MPNLSEALNSYKFIWFQSLTQPENAENLSFKDKMAFFAKAIGEDMPKDRYKASQKERQIVNSLLR